MTTTYAIGRSKTGDQLHCCSVYSVGEDGSVKYGGCNSHCNNHMHLRPLAGTPAKKTSLRFRPGLFCVKCFGSDPTGREFVNVTIEGVVK